MWTQISEHFSDYSYKLIFESANEELCHRLNDSDVTGTEGVLSEDECYETTNRINSEFVKLVRSTGGKMQTDSCLSQGTTPTSGNMR